MMLLLAALPARGHEFRPAVLDLHLEGDSASLAWRLPLALVEDATTPLKAAPSCQLRLQDERSTESYRQQRFRLDCPQGLHQAWLDLPRLPASDVLVRRLDGNGEAHLQHLPTGESRLWLAPPAAVTAGGANLLREGLLHVFAGPDHLLYIGLLYLFLRGSARRLLTGVTLFTLAHSLSLGLAVVGLLRMPAAPVEAGIALTICYFAAAIWHGERAGQQPSWRWQLAVLLCGLLHGLGFAGSLSGLGLLGDALLWNLASFNLGIELAQLAVIATLALLLAAGRRLPACGRHPDAGRWAATLAGSVGAYWYFQRLLG